MNYKITEWKGLDNYECVICPFATLKQEEIKDHMRIHIEIVTEKIKEDNPQPVEIAEELKPDNPDEVLKELVEETKPKKRRKKSAKDEN